jgi:DNA-binding NtrC family response regulator
MPDLLSVLVVDDDPEIRGLFVELFSSYFTTHSADSAADAIGVLETHPINVLVSDIRMPGHDGLWLADQTKKRWPTVGIVLMSGYSSGLPKRASLHWRFLRKPSRFSDVLKAVRAAAQEAS